MKEIEETRKNMLCSLRRGVNGNKTFKLPKAIYRFNPILIKRYFFLKRQEKNSKTHMIPQRPQTHDWILRKNNSAGVITFLDFKYTTSNQCTMVLALETDTQINGKKKGPQINSCTYGELVFNKGSRNIQWRNSLFNK